MCKVLARRASLTYGVPMTHTPDLIGTAEAASILGKSHRTVHRMVDAGTLTPALVAPGGFKGVYLFNRRDVERLAHKDAA